MKTSRIDAAKAAACGYIPVYGTITTAHAGVSVKEDGKINYFIAVNVFDGNRSIKVIVNYMGLAKVLLMQDENEVRENVKSVVDAVASAHRFNALVDDVKQQQSKYEKEMMAMAKENLLNPNFDINRVEKMIEMNLKFLTRENGLPNDIENVKPQMAERQLPMLMGRQALVWVLKMSEGKSYVDPETDARFISEKGGEKKILDSITSDTVEFNFQVDTDDADGADADGADAANQLH